MNSLEHWIWDSWTFCCSHCRQLTSLSLYWLPLPLKFIIVGNCDITCFKKSRTKKVQCWVCIGSHHHTVKSHKKVSNPDSSLELLLHPLWGFFFMLSCSVPLRSRQNSCLCCRGSQNIVTPSNCVAATLTQKELASVCAACCKPKLRCGTRPQTKIRNVQ